MGELVGWQPAKHMKNTVNEKHQIWAHTHTPSQITSSTYSKNSEYSHSHRGHGFVNSAWCKKLQFGRKLLFLRVFIFKSMHLASWSDTPQKERASHTRRLCSFTFILHQDVLLIHSTCAPGHHLAIDILPSCLGFPYSPHKDLTSQTTNVLAHTFCTQTLYRC